MRGMRCVWAVVLAVAPVGIAVAEDGERLYLDRCAPCHGAARDGAGPDASIFNPRPRALDGAFVARYDAAQLVDTVLNGAALPLALDADATKRRLGEVDLLVAHLRHLPDIDWDAFARGRSLYFDRCQRCHGPFGDPGALPPGGRAPRSLGALGLREKPRPALLRLLRHADVKQPTLDPPLSDAEAASLVPFARELTPGFALYARFCASCHGLDGRADELVDPGHAPQVVFDRAWARHVDGERLHVRVWHMLSGQRPAMPHFRTRLSEAEARAIVEWLKAPPTARP